MEWLDRVFAYIYWGSISAVVVQAHDPVDLVGGVGYIMQV